MNNVSDFSKEKIIFDVGHQCYTYKLLTGRKLDNLRQKDGVSGFQKMNESKYDHYEAGHSSTSISAANGFAIARDLNKEKYALQTNGNLRNQVATMMRVFGPNLCMTYGCGETTAYTRPDFYMQMLGFNTEYFNDGSLKYNTATICNSVMNDCPVIITGSRWEGNVEKVHTWLIDGVAQKIAEKTKNTGFFDSIEEILLRFFRWTSSLIDKLFFSKK